MEAELEVPEGEALSLVSTPTRIGNTTCRPHSRRQPGSEKKSRVRARHEEGEKEGSKGFPGQKFSKSTLCVFCLGHSVLHCT